jgi:hypothetical protein
MTLKRIWATAKKWWWVAVGALFAIAVFVFVGTRRGRRFTKVELLTGKDTGTISQNLQQMAVIEAEGAQVDILIEQAKADTKIEAKLDELKRIEKEPDPTVRRRRLARFAEQNI